MLVFIRRRLGPAILALVLCGALPAAPRARAAEPLVAPAWLAARLQDPRVVVLDLRAAADYAAGHIPGAVPADYATAGWREARSGGAAGALPPPERIGARIGALGVGDADHAVIVADDFAAAARVHWTFKVLGHAEVSVLDGGWRSWQGPVERGPGRPRPAAVFTPRHDPALHAGLADVAAAIGTGAVTLVDARPPGQWSGAERSPVVRRAGHLPGAVPVDQRAVLASDGRLKSPEALAGLFAAAGNRPTISYCNTGHLAAVDWFVLSEILRRPGARLYDGSMSEWTADPARPVER